MNRVLIALAGGLVAALLALVGSWIIASAFTLIGWQIPVASGVAVAGALWFIDWLTDYLAARKR